MRNASWHYATATGVVVAQSNEKYFFWIEKVADGEKPETQLDLAKAYYVGDGVKKRPQ